MDPVLNMAIGGLCLGFAVLLQGIVGLTVLSRLDAQRKELNNLKERLVALEKEGAKYRAEF